MLVFGIDPGVTGHVTILLNNVVEEVIPAPIEKLPTGKKTAKGNDKMRESLPSIRNG